MRGLLRFVGSRNAKLSRRCFWTARRLGNFRCSARSGGGGLSCGLLRRGCGARNLRCFGPGDRRHDVKGELVITVWSMKVERRFWSYG